MRVLFRILAFGLAVIAFVLLVIDGATMIAAKTVILTPTADVLARLTDAGAIERWQAIVSRRIHPLAWTALNHLILSVPALVLAAVGSFLCWLIGRKREPDFDLRPKGELR